LRGQTLNLPAVKVEEFEVDSYEQIDVDESTMAKLGVEDRVKHLVGEIAMLDSSIEAATKRLGELKGRRKMVRDKVRQANDELKRIEAEAQAKAEAARAAAEAKAKAEAEAEAVKDKGKDDANDGKTETPEPAAAEKAAAGRSSKDG
jgi:colicin import membrane protein